MDLRFTGPEATAEERAPVDAALAGRRPTRDLLLPVLHAVYDRFGSLPPGALDYVARRLEVPPAELHGVATFYHRFSRHGESICDDIVCRMKGQKEGNSPCLGLCEQAPAKSRDTGWDVRKSIPQWGDPNLRILGNITPGKALARAKELGPEGVLRVLNEAKLVGRGGAAFPTARKWEAVMRAPAKPHYLVCNADESEPGTFKDRVLMESNPAAVVEGMRIAAYVAGCESSFLYIRGEYPKAIRRIQEALGDFNCEIRRGGGAYICGEETALFNSIEGKRGEPRSKPPFPVQVGLFGKPTVVNNVETLVSVLPILGEGVVDRKLFCVCGMVDRPGVYEIPLGTPLRDLLAMAGTRTVKGVLLGGAAGTFLGPHQLDTPLQFGSATLGSGVVMVMDDTVDLTDLLHRIARFFREESCGQCVPCRVGTVKQEDALKAGELARIKEIGQVMRDASICGLGQTASSAIESAIANLGWEAPPPEAHQSRREGGPK